MTISFSAYTPRVDYDAELGTGTASQWDDQSGNGHHATQATGSKQMAITSGANLINGLPARRAVWGTGTTGKCWDIPDAAFSGMTGAVGAEAFIVYMRDFDPGISANSTDGGLWQLGNGNGSWHPYPPNLLYYENFCSSARKDNIFPGIWRRSCFKPHIWNAWSATNDFGVIFNGGLKFGATYTTATNTFQVPPAGNAKLGCSGTSADGGAGAYAFTGHIWRFLLFARKLTTTERTEITGALTTYYQAQQSLDIVKATRSFIIPDGFQIRDAPYETTLSEDRKLTTSRTATTASLTGPLTDQRDSRPLTKAEARTSFSSGEVVASDNTSNTTAYYKMRGRDVDAGSLTYRSWVVSETPDTTGGRYTGPKSGSNPLADITVVSFWQVSDVAAQTFTWRGAWSNVTTYDPNDVVQHSGSTYIALLAGTNQNPTTATSYWELFVSANGNAGWKTAYHVDLTTLGNVSRAGDGVIVLDGKNWYLENSTNASAISNVASTGFVITVNGNGSELYNGTRTAPIISAKLTDLVDSSVSWGSVDRVRIRAVFSWSNIDSDFEGVKIGFENYRNLVGTNSVGGAYNTLIGRVFDSSNVYQVVKTIAGASAQVNTTNSLTDDCVIIEWSGPWSAKFHTAASSGGSVPAESAWNFRGLVQNPLTTGIVNQTGLASWDALAVFFSVGTGNQTSKNVSGTLKSLTVEVQ